MNRREAYFNFSKILINDNDSKESYVHKTKYKDLIIKIYDDFENRSCENCNTGVMNTDNSITCMAVARPESKNSGEVLDGNYYFRFDKDFCCNRWESK